MGTSTSSAGPGGGVPFDPPWLDQIAGGGDSGDASGNGDDEGESGDPAVPNSDGREAAPPAGASHAPARRFLGARRALKIFARTGDKGSFAKAAGHYSKSGMGGAKKVAARMRTSTRSASGLVGILQAARDRVDPQVTQWVSSLIASKASVQDVINQIIEQVMTGGGSIDEEACKDSMAQSMAELLELNPDAELLNMRDSDIWTLVELFLGNEACSRMQLDIGQLFESATLPPREAVLRTNEMRNFLKAELGTQLQTLRSRQPDPSPVQLERMMRSALELTFSIYEGEI
jgi:hypothetical protein